MHLFLEGEEDAVNQLLFETGVHVCNPKVLYDLFNAPHKKKLDTGINIIREEKQKNKSKGIEDSIKIKKDKKIKIKRDQKIKKGPKNKKRDQKIKKGQE